MKVRELQYRGFTIVLYCYQFTVYVAYVAFPFARGFTSPIRRTNPGATVMLEVGYRGYDFACRDSFPWPTLQDQEHTQSSDHFCV